MPDGKQRDKLASVSVKSCDNSLRRESKQTLKNPRRENGMESGGGEKEKFVIKIYIRGAR